MAIKFNSNLTIIYEKLYDFFHACIDQKQRNQNGYEQIYEIIEKLGGWPMLDGRSWNQTDYRWENAYVIDAQLEQEYLIGIEPIIDFRNTSKIIIKLAPPYKTSENIINLMGRNSSVNGDPIMEQTKRLYLKMLKILRQNRRPQENQTDDQLNDQELSAAIDELFDIQLRLQDFASQKHSMSYYQNNYEKHLMNISTIKSNIDFDISYILENIFGRTFTDDEVLFVPDIEYLIHLNPLLAATPKQ
ncbi:neprilysin-like protein [Euroglyphus maynei]|uniref:Neprilysin-like protein n=1 Tax=Euroglyphus maynei TaxID=6958 RepID=A0A1Y3BE13_EURMA|nr:neprilysin-like protein [Euroglyphus maynei]